MNVPNHLRHRQGIELCPAPFLDRAWADLERERPTRRLDAGRRTGSQDWEIVHQMLARGNAGNLLRLPGTTGETTRDHSTSIGQLHMLNSICT
jgi:hypothetical protein